MIKHFVITPTKILFLWFLEKVEAEKVHMFKMNFSRMMLFVSITVSATTPFVSSRRNG